MTREEAIEYVSFQMDDAHDRRHAKPSDVNPDDRLVGRLRPITFPAAHRWVS